MTVEKWFIGHRRPHVLGATSWYGAYHTEADAAQDKDAVNKYWFRRAGMNGPHGYTFIERDDDADVDFGELTIERHHK